MRKHIENYYKSYDGIHENEIERKEQQFFNEYGYNFDSNQKRTTNLSELASKTKPQCLRLSRGNEKG